MSFFLIFLSTFIALSFFNSRGRKRSDQLRLPAHVDEQFKVALSQNNYAELVKYYRLVLKRELAPLDQQLIRINLAHALTGLKEYQEALEELDHVELKYVSPAQVALWLNNRAYVFLQIGDLENAMENINDAFDLLEGDESLRKNATLLACLSGTKGIIHFKKGNFDEAEHSLQRALRLEEEGRTHRFGSTSETEDPSRVAEDWYWLSEVAKAKGDFAQARHALQKAACFPLTDFGAQAGKILKEVWNENK